MWHEVAFPRDGTSRCPFVPGQGHYLRPIVPLSRDKGQSKCPGTNSSVPGRPGTKSFSIFAHFQKKIRKTSSFHDKVLREFCMLHNQRPFISYQLVYLLSCKLTFASCCRSRSKLFTRVKLLADLVSCNSIMLQKHTNMQQQHSYSKSSQGRKIE